MAGVVARHKAGVILMHMQGTPSTMQRNPQYTDVVAEVKAFLVERVDACLAASSRAGATDRGSAMLIALTGMPLAAVDWSISAGSDLAASSSSRYGARHCRRARLRPGSGPLFTSSRSTVMPGHSAASQATESSVEAMS